jgi:hypothetical protein
MVYTNAIEAGNKILANTNRISIFGMPRKNYRSKLLVDAFPTKSEK